MFNQREFETATNACDEALRALERDELVVAGTDTELDRVLHLLSSLALSKHNKNLRAVVENLITRRLALEHTDRSLASLQA